jgi:hypothetical protein
MMRIVILAFVLSASLAFGQLDSNAVTVTASRNASLQADTVVFSVAVTSGINAGLDDIVAVLAGSGITAANFSSVSSPQFIPASAIAFPQPAPPMMQWSFTLPVPLSKLKDMATALTTVQQNIASKNSGMTMSFSVQGTRVSPQLQQSQPCVVSDLLADARSQAQRLANAAGLTLGQILALSSSTSSTTGSSSFAGFLVGPPNCAVTVQFALIRLSQ